MAKKTSILFGRAYTKGRFLFLFILMLVMLVLAPLIETFFSLRIVLNILWSAIFLTAVYAVSQKRHVFFIGVLLALPMLLSLWFQHIVESSWVPLVGNFFGVLFMAFTIVQILNFIFKERNVHVDLITGAAVTYFLIALMWAFIYASLEKLHPGSFSITEGKMIHSQMVFVYYSFVTISTLGYGDITPLTNLASSVSMLEAVCGQLYIAVLIAWLVGSHISQSVGGKNRKE